MRKVRFEAGIILLVLAACAGGIGYAKSVDGVLGGDSTLRTVALLADPFGHKWHLATRKEDVSPAEMQRRMDAAYL